MTQHITTITDVRASTHELEFSPHATVIASASAEGRDASLIVKIPGTRIHLWLDPEQRETLIRALSVPVPAQRQSDE